MKLHPLAWLAGLLPLVCIHITYWLAASHGQVPWCFPYIDSCTSISATGREAPAYHVFKGIMIPAAVLLMGYWIANAQWLASLGCPRRCWLWTLRVVGVLAGSGLIFYSVYLGAIGPEHRQFRHTGVLTFFGFTLFAQLVITWLLGELATVRDRYRRSLRLLQALMALDLLVGLANVVIGFANPALYDDTNDAFAWIFTLLLCLHVLVTATLWRRTDFRLAFSARG